MVHIVAVLALTCSLVLRMELAEASSAAGTETLVGIVGKDFVLLGADSSVSQSIALTASNLDKIAHLVDPFPDAYASDKKSKSSRLTSPQQLPEQSSLQPKRQQTILAAAAGDAADSDRLLGYLKALGSLEEYKNGRMGCDVVKISLGGGNQQPSKDSSQGLDAFSMAHLARRCIWENLRSRTPYRICLLVAGMRLVDEKEQLTSKSPDPIAQGAAFLSQKVQNQVQQARQSAQTEAEPTISTNEISKEDTTTSLSSTNSCYKPSLFWLDEYGSLQDIEYGAHGHGSNFLLSILDQHYRPDLTRSEALELMKECFRELRSRYVINSPEAPCIKCVDANGVCLL